VAPWEKIFEHVSIDNFKMMGNNILKSLRVALLNPVTVIKNIKEKEAILSTFHDDPIQGGHTGKNLGQGPETLLLEKYVQRHKRVHKEMS